ncbi:hypothetical protein DFP72DRAFT_1093052 [Ephemerocybe angulata]|uniref:Uncharacterized protein n=1 Tax=Ephemerocybe angulata TaxID=980116 RepID=A0A8H6HEM4_9AGAR|nr:hypothetical protein DFP72DRAFT_1093052 [Tulosesus angulatus]
MPRIQLPCAASAALPQVPSITQSTFPNLVKLVTYRHAHETFDTEDYTIYVRQVCSILKTRPGIARAALMRGGIVWRLTMEYVSPDDVLCGPSQSAMEGEGIVRRNGTGGFLVDDALQVQEVEAICGHIDFWIKNYNLPVCLGGPQMIFGINVTASQAGHQMQRTFITIGWRKLSAHGNHFRVFFTWRDTLQEIFIKVLKLSPRIDLLFKPVSIYTGNLELDTFSTTNFLYQHVALSQTGLGKLTLINTIFALHLIDSKDCFSNDKPVRQTTEIQADKFPCITLCLNIVGAQIDSEDSEQRTVQLVTTVGCGAKHFEGYSKKESKLIDYHLSKKTLAPAKEDELRVKANILAAFSENAEEENLKAPVFKLGARSIIATAW